MYAAANSSRVIVRTFRKTTSRDYHLQQRLIAPDGGRAFRFPGEMTVNVLPDDLEAGECEPRFPIEPERSTEIIRIGPERHRPEAELVAVLQQVLRDVTVGEFVPRGSAIADKVDDGLGVLGTLAEDDELGVAVIQVEAD